MLEYERLKRETHEKCSVTFARLKRQQKEAESQRDAAVARAKEQKEASKSYAPDYAEKLSTRIVALNEEIKRLKDAHTGPNPAQRILDLNDKMRKMQEAAKAQSAEMKEAVSKAEEQAKRLHAVNGKLRYDNTVMQDR